MDGKDSWAERELSRRAERFTLPSTLFINGESRCETLRHYQVVFSPRLERPDYSQMQQYLAYMNDQKPCPPLCFNPNLDAVYEYPESLLNLRGDFGYRLSNCRYIFLKEHRPDVLKEVKVLHLIYMVAARDVQDGRVSVCSWHLAIQLSGTD